MFLNVFYITLNVIKLSSSNLFLRGLLLPNELSIVCYVYYNQIACNSDLCIYIVHFKIVILFRLNNYINDFFY